MGRVFVMGDIHGAYRALIQCLERSQFDYEHDHLISLGDVCDGWPETKRCIDQLLRIKNLTYVLGNHDTWLLDWMKTGNIANIWYVQGGEASIMSYSGKSVPEEHIQFLNKALPYYKWGGKLFVHAGIEMDKPLDQQTNETFLWDRTLARTALKRFSEGSTKDPLTRFEEVYIGHTPTSFGQPLKACEVWLMDTGAGWEGCLSMMDVESKEVFVSDNVPSLYPGVEGRRRR